MATASSLRLTRGKPSANLQMYHHLFDYHKGILNKTLSNLVCLTNREFICKNFDGGLEEEGWHISKREHDFIALKLLTLARKPRATVEAA